MNIARQLGKSFFKDSIYFGLDNQRRGTRISLTALVSSMVNNNLVLDTFEATWNKFSITFSIMSSRISFGNDSFFKTNGGIRVLFRLINLFERNLLAKKLSVTEEEFFDDLSKILDTQTIIELEKSSGTFVGALDATSSLVEKMKNYDKKYSKMESDLRLLRI